MKKLTLLILAASATPAFAASGPFFSLFNTNFVVWLAFIAFIAVLVYLKVPGKLGGALDARANDIRSELDEAKALREEAQTLLASYERKQREVAEQSERIIVTAKEEAAVAAAKAKDELKTSIERRLAAAEDQITSAEAKAIQQVRDSAVSVAIGAAGDAIAAKMTAADSNALIDEAIADAGSKLH